MDDDQQMALKETKTKALTLLFPKEICFSLSFSHTPPSVLEDWANSGADFQELGGKGGLQLEERNWKSPPVLAQAEDSYRL